MVASLPDDVKALLDGPNFAHLATLRRDGTPQVDPIWVGRDGERIPVGTGENTVKAKNAYRDLLALWANADPGVPILKQARAEYAKLR